MKKAITLNALGDLDIRGGSMFLSDTTLQETAIILGMNPGEDKFTPMLGPGLVRMLKGKANRVTVERLVKLHLSLDNKNYDDLKKYIHLKIRS